MPNTRQAFQEALLERSKKEKAMTGIHVGFFRTVNLKYFGSCTVLQLHERVPKPEFTERFLRSPHGVQSR